MNKNVKKHLSSNFNNKKIIIVGVCAFIIGLLMSGGVVKALGELLASNIVYDNSTSGLTSTDVQSAINELNTKSNEWIDPSYIDFTTLATNTKKTVLASSAGVCIKRNNKVNCFKPNNWEEEQNHIPQVFSDINCTVNSLNVGCTASDFYCGAYPNGRVACNDRSDYSICNVYSDGSVSCT